MTAAAYEHRSNRQAFRNIGEEGLQTFWISVGVAGWGFGANIYFGLVFTSAPPPQRVNDRPAYVERGVDRVGSPNIVNREHLRADEPLEFGVRQPGNLIAA